MVQLHSLQRFRMVMDRLPSLGHSFRWLRNTCWCAATDPVEDIARVKAPASDAESLRDEQPAQVRAAHGLLVTADELGHFERGEEPIWQPAVCECGVIVQRCAGHTTVCSESECAVLVTTPPCARGARTCLPTWWKSRVPVSAAATDAQERSSVAAGSRGGNRERDVQVTSDCRQEERSDARRRTRCISFSTILIPRDGSNRGVARIRRRRSHRRMAVQSSRRVP